MDTLSAFAMALGAQGNELRCFDWDKAARLIVEHKPQTASAGLGQDWKYTGGTIFENGKAVTDCYTYLASTWAMPELDLDGTIFECYVGEKEAKKKKWYAETKWPASALKILRQGTR